MKLRPRLGLALIIFDILLLSAYLVVEILLPDAPAQDTRQIIYPLFLLFRSSLIFHAVTITIIVVAGVLGLRMRYGLLKPRVVNGILLGGIVLILYSMFNVGASNYRHHDTIRVRSTYFQLGSAPGSDPGTLSYLVYRCDQIEFFCNLASVPYTGPDPSQLPNGTSQDRAARFGNPESERFDIIINGQSYPALSDAPP